MHATGSPDPRFDRLSSHSALSPGTNARWRRAAGRVIVAHAVWAISSATRHEDGTSITAKAPRRFDRLEFGEIEIGDRPQGFGCGAVLLVVRQRLQPGGIAGL